MYYFVALFLKTPYNFKFQLIMHHAEACHTVTKVLNVVFKFWQLYATVAVAVEPAEEHGRPVHGSLPLPFSLSASIRLLLELYSHRAPSSSYS